MSSIDYVNNMINQMKALEIPQYIQSDNSTGTVENPNYTLNQQAITTAQGVVTSIQNFISSSGSILTGNTTTNPCPLSILDIGGQVGNFLNDLGNTVANLFSGACSGLMSLINNFGNLLGGIGSDILNGVISSITPPDSYFSGLNDFISQMSDFGSLLDNTMGTITSTVSSLVSGISSSLSSAMNFINCLPSALSPGTMNALNSVGSFGSNGDLMNQINTMKATGVSPSSIYNNIISGLNSSFQIPQTFTNLSNLVKAIA